MELTHEELLEEIDNHTISGVANPVLADALRAVVELHKPGKNDDEELGCRECSKLMMDGSRVLTYRYPCPTIKAIQKELE